MIEIWLAFVAGITGSFHCIGMCGGFAAALSMTGTASSLRCRVLAQLTYTLGRISTYTLLGAGVAWAGSSLDLMAVKSFSDWIFIAANVFVISVGLCSALGAHRLGLSLLEGTGGRLLSRPIAFMLRHRSPLRGYPMGLILGLLPCGLVYAPLVVAAGSGSPLLGGGLMAALGMGTVPVMLLFGTASSAISGTVRTAMFRGAGLAVALMGAAGLWRVLTKSCPHCSL